MANKPHHGLESSHRNAAAFSLVEVVVAMGIVSFALILMVALVPIGLKTNSTSMGESQAVNLLQALIADRQGTPYAQNSSVYNLPALAKITSPVSGTFYVMEDTVTTNAQPAVARYQVNYTAYPENNIYPTATNYPTTGPVLPLAMHFQVSWPAASTNRPSSVETVATFMQP
jgi:uncharacterized protein (TIGR02598 family)